MATFRPGKPWLQLFVDDPQSQAAGLHAIDWQSSQGDSDGLDWSPAGDTVNVDRAGLYLVILNVGRLAPSSSSQATSAIVVDGAIVSGTRPAASATVIRTSCSIFYSASAASTISTLVQLHSSATADFEFDSTNLTIVRLGPVRWTG